MRMDREDLEHAMRTVAHMVLRNPEPFLADRETLLEDKLKVLGLECFIRGICSHNTQEDLMAKVEMIREANERVKWDGQIIFRD